MIILQTIRQTSIRAKAEQVSALDPRRRSSGVFDKTGLNGLNNEGLNGKAI